jgi:hypothetical protein
VWFQVHVPPLVGVLLIFRSRYWFAIGRQGVLSLGRWASRIRTRFHVSRLTQVPASPLRLSPTGLSPAVVELSRTVRLGSEVHVAGPTTPPGLGLNLARLRTVACFPLLPAPAFDRHRSILGKRHASFSARILHLGTAFHFPAKTVLFRGPPRRDRRSRPMPSIAYRTLPQTRSA